MNPNNPLDGTSYLHGVWRTMGGHLARPLDIHSYGYERLAVIQTASQLASPFTPALMDCWG